MIRLLLLLVLSVAVIGCGSAKPDPQVAELKKQIAALTTRLEAAELTAGKVSEVISQLKPIANELQAGRTLPESLKLRSLDIVDENGETRIKFGADSNGSHAWLGDHRQKRILLIAQRRDDMIGDYSGIVFQQNGTDVVWKTPDATN